MSASSIRRRLREHFGISAPRMTVRTSLPWWERGVAVIVAGAVVGGLVWCAFAMGQAEGRASAGRIDRPLGVQEAEAASAQDDATALRTRNSALESDLAVSRAAEQALSQQVADLSAESARLREEILVLKRLVGDNGAPAASRRLR